MLLLTPNKPIKMDRYLLLQEVGQGGMATVYRSRDTLLDREVALKILHPHLAKDPLHRKRFRREAKAIARLHHPNIVEVYDFSDKPLETKDTPTYLVMEYVKGQNLQQFLDQTEFDLPELGAALVATIARALEHAHQQQIIHRDLKPENVLIRNDGTPKLSDFGLARILDSESMTRTGAILGSPAYMSPEQVCGRTGDHLADQFALGVLLFRLTCQQHPFLKNNPAATLQAIAQGQVPNPQQTKVGIGRELSDLITRALAKEPESRFPSTSVFRQELLSYLKNSGLEQPDAILRSYLVNPEHTAPQIQKRIQAHLQIRAKQLASQKKYSAALDVCNRVLALDPGNLEIQLLLDRLSQQSHWSSNKWLWLAIACTFIFIVSAYIYHKTEAPSVVTPRNNPAFIVLKTEPSKEVPKERFHEATRFEKSTSEKELPDVRRIPEKKRIRPRLNRLRTARLKRNWTGLKPRAKKLQIRYQKYDRYFYLLIRQKIKSSIWYKFEKKRRRRLKRRRLARIRLTRKGPYKLSFQISREEKLSYILSSPKLPDWLRRNLSKSIEKPDKPPKGNPPVPKKKKTSLGPKRLFKIFTYPYANITVDNGAGKHKAKQTPPAAKFFIESGRDWLLTVKGASAFHVERFKLRIPAKGRILIQKTNIKKQKLSSWSPLKTIKKIPEYRIRLRLKNASLQIRCNVAGAALYINNNEHRSFLKTQNKTIPISFKGQHKLERTLELRVIHTNHITWTKKIKIRAGSTKKLNMIKLLPKSRSVP